MARGLKARVRAVLPAWAERQVMRRFYNRELARGEFELKLIAQLVRSDQLAVDIGANIGTYTYHMSRHARRVEAFEPNPDVAWRLRGQFGANVTVNLVALSSGYGPATFQIPIAADGGEVTALGSLVDHGWKPGEARKIIVPMMTLDAYELEQVGLIKIDVEGHEEAVLDGAARTIARERPNLLVECESRHNPGGIERLCSRMAGLDYAGAFYLDGVRRPVAEFSSDLQAQDRTPEAYVNNFLFRPREKVTTFEDR